jgi:hypothetical protein
MPYLFVDKLSIQSLEVFGEPENGRMRRCPPRRRGVTHVARIPSPAFTAACVRAHGIQITVSYEEPQFVPQPRRAKTFAPLPGGKCEARYECRVVGRNATMRVCHWPPPGLSHSAWGCDRQRQKAGRSRRFQGLPFDRGEGRRVMETRAVAVAFTSVKSTSNHPTQKGQ